MSEFKLHHLVVELSDLLGCTKYTPEEIVEFLQKNINTQNNAQAHFDVYTEVQDLSRKLPNPEAFLSKYEELKQKNVDSLGAFVHIIQQVSSNDGIKELLRKTHKPSMPNSCGRSAMTSADLPQVRHNLKKATAQKLPASLTPRTDHSSTSTAASLNNRSSSSGSAILTLHHNGHGHGGGQAVTSVRSWVQRFPSMSWDFGSVTTLSSTTGGSLGSVSSSYLAIAATSQEHVLMDDVLNILIGVPGTYIEPLPLAHPHATREFVLKETIADPPLRELIRQIIPLGAYYSSVQRFVEEKQRFEFGRVNNALAECMYNILVEYTLFVSQLETEYRSDNINIHKLWYYIQKNLHSLNILNNIVTTINKSDACGGKVLSLLHDNIAGYIGDSGAQNLCVHLMESASVPYMKMLGMWIYNGIISDPMHEFIVEDNEVVQKEEMPQDYSADYWDKKYTIRRERIPKFLEPITDIILRAGKYLNVIRQCGKSLSNRIEPIAYRKEEKGYLSAIEKAYQYASRTLLDLVLKEQDLLGRLRSVKHYFLLDQGDFIVTLLALCEKELQKDVNDVVQARLDSLVDLALRISSATNDPYKEDLRTELLPYDLQFQMFKILMIQTFEEQNYKAKNRRTGLSVIESFAFGYEVRWPLSLVLNRKSLARYQMIFRHLFYCKYVERLVCQVWRANKVAKKFATADAMQYRAAFSLRQRMLHCIQNLEYHMMVEVIEPHWCNFTQKMSKVTNVDEVLSCHNDFLDSCLKDCMLTIPSLLAIITKLLHICVKFSKFMQECTKYVATLRSVGEMSIETEHADLEAMTDTASVESFQQSITRFDLEFTTAMMQLLEEIRNQNKDISDHDRLFNLLYRLDFNTFYTGQFQRMHIKAK